MCPYRRPVFDAVPWPPPHVFWQSLPAPGKIKMKIHELLYGFNVQYGSPSLSFELKLGTWRVFANRFWYFLRTSSFWSRRPCRLLMVWWATFRVGWLSESSCLLRSARSFSLSAVAGRRSLSSLITLSRDKTFCSDVHKAASFSFSFCSETKKPLVRKF